MHPIIYDVAVSADGFIAGPGGDVAAFPHAGSIVADYLARLEGYKAVLMGRATYEFGYAFGLPPGANPYPHARSTVVSSTIDLPEGSEVTVWRTLSADAVTRLRRDAGGPIYLCGGGQLAGALMEMGQITDLRLKRAPIVLGGGTPLFADLNRAPKLSLMTQRDHGDGVLYQAFAVQ